MLIHVRYLGVILLLLLSVACSSTPPAVPTIVAPTAVPATAAPPPTQPAPTVVPASVPTSEIAAGQPAWEPFNPAAFNASTIINNRYMPLTPGTRYIYEGTTIEDDGTAVPHRIEIHVTDLTKVIGGVKSVVTWDLDFSDGELVEAELAFFAQDDTGAVWRMGEYPETYDAGTFVEASPWLHGIADAQAGISMLAAPAVGTPSYSQGWGPAVGWSDRGTVDEIVGEVCVATGCYNNVLVVAETSTSEPDAQQLKYWAPTIGNIRTGWRGAGEKTKETLELTALEQLDAAALAEVRTKALELEKNAYERSADVYGTTQPLEYPGMPAAGINGTASEPSPTAAAEESDDQAEEVVLYAAELDPSALREFEFWDDPAAPGGKLVGTRHTGQELDPPPEDDPHVLFETRVIGGVPYRCWVHMKVGTPEGVSQANKLWLQFSNAVDQANNEILKPDSASYLTAQGPTEQGWSWVGCTMEGADQAKSLIYFRSSGMITVRIQAGMEGVGFSQFILSPARYLEQPPSEAIVTK
jgi:hypothetical protein